MKNYLLKINNIIKKALDLNSKKFIFYITIITGVLIFFLSGLITRGHSFYNLFQFNKLDYFMDFYNPLATLFNGPYSNGSIYPSLPQLFYRIMLRFIPYDIAGQGASAIRASQSGEVVFLFYVLITLLVFFILLMEAKKGFKIEKYIFAFAMVFSAPFLFQFERANVVFVALLFLMMFVFFKDSKNRVIRELALISLAMSVGIKLYPALFGILLLKEGRIKDAFRLLLYGLAAFILPFFLIGGISQVPLLVKNILNTSNGALSWGVGYAVNVQSMTRLLLGFFGYFSDNTVFIGSILSFITLVLGVISIFFLHSKWKTTALLTLLIILVPSISFEYVLIFMVIPLVMFLDEEKREKWDYLYLTCFILIFIPLPLSTIDSLTYQFGAFARPLTYGVLIQNIAISVMTISLIVQGLKMKPKNTLGPLRKILQNVVVLRTQKSLSTNIKSLSAQITKFNKFYWIISVFVILVYNLTFFNKFYPITEGWFSTYAWMINHGQFPYRDFYFFLTPFYLVKMSLFTAIFGYDIFALRIFGIGAMLLMTYFLYKNIEIIFGAAIAVFIAIVGIIYYQSGNAHITYDFTQFVTLYGLIQSYFLLKYVKASDLKSKDGIRWVFLAGLFAGLAFLTKQSNGMMIVAFSFVGILILSISNGWKEFLRIFLLYVSGFAITLVITVLWLVMNSAFMPFLQQIFSGAIVAKGGFSQIFFSWFKGILTYNFVVKFTEILAIVLIFGYWVYFFPGRKWKNKNMNEILMPIASIFMLFVVLLPFFIDKVTIYQLSRLGRHGINNIIVAAISIPIISILTAAISFILKKPFNRSIFLFSFVSLGFIYGTGTSAGITEVGAFAGFCLFIALMLHYRSLLGLGKIFIVLFCISFCLMLVEGKYENPYSWWNVTSPDIRGKLQSTNGIQMLNGMYTSPDNIKLIKEVSAEIRSGSKPGEPILTFPNIPIFYLLTDRRPPGKALVYWFDFLPDQMAIKEAELIKKNPPKVIVYLDLGPSVWEAHERLFRDGKPSGQREIVKSFMEVIKSKKMNISKKYRLANNVVLTVWKE